MVRSTTSRRRREATPSPRPGSSTSGGGKRRIRSSLASEARSKHNPQAPSSTPFPLAGLDASVYRPRLSYLSSSCSVGLHRLSSNGHGQVSVDPSSGAWLSHFHPPFLFLSLSAAGRKSQLPSDAMRMPIYTDGAAGPVSARSAVVDGRGVSIRRGCGGLAPKKPQDVHDMSDRRLSVLGKTRWRDS